MFSFIKYWKKTLCLLFSCFVQQCQVIGPCEAFQGQGECKCCINSISVSGHFFKQIGFFPLKNIFFSYHEVLLLLIICLFFDLKNSYLSNRQDISGRIRHQRLQLIPEHSDRILIQDSVQYEKLESFQGRSQVCLT